MRVDLPITVWCSDARVRWPQDQRVALRKVACAGLWISSAAPKRGWDPFFSLVPLLGHPRVDSWPAATSSHLGRVVLISLDLLPLWLWWGEIPDEPPQFVTSFKLSNWSNKKMLTGVHYSQLSMSPWNTKSYSVRERANRHLHFQISIWEKRKTSVP